MSVYASPEIDRIVAIDQAHANLVASLVACRKPRTLLELGFGTGESCRAILRALGYNGLAVDFTVVDNWLDFKGQPPAEIKKPDYKGVKFVTSDEEAFVQGCERRFQFIFSDADHLRAQEWFDRVYDQLLDREGVLIYHDVTNPRPFPNLLQIYADCIRRDLHHMLFNYSSREDEKCERGLLVIFKH